VHVFHGVVRVTRVLGVTFDNVTKRTE
jgi:hypothetical protein